MWVRIVFVIAAMLVTAPTWDGPPRLPLFGPRAELRIVALPPPANPVSGRLRWLAGARLESNDPAFGGFSALAVAGRRFTVLNDGGNFVQFTLDRRFDAAVARFGALPDGPYGGWEKRDRDSESLAVGPDGRFWIGFERANAVWRYSPDLMHAEGSVRPRAMRRWPTNGGAEAMVRIADGRFVVFSEGSLWRGKPGRAALVLAGDPIANPDRGFRFSYVPAPGFAVADAATLPGGDILVLERRWRLPLRFESRLALLKVAALKPGARVSGAELGRIAPRWPTENYEGVAATREGAATILWLVSDNDQAWWRPSYLLKLRLD